ncbi:prepilin peptidase [Neosynechococcus sphagnicola]|uniref:prepilin peptidase n=1 Tax=Neosynechococcus sphagnicola TaxID=1501145 RepID=UPI000AF7DDCA
MLTLIHLIIYLFVFSFGAAVGSFLNVVIYRLPAGLSILWPPSRCPHCLQRLRKTENLPVVGWLWLRGRCGHCCRQIAIRYPLVEAAVGMMFLVVFSDFGISLLTLGYWVFLSWLLVLAMIDLDTMTLPNSLTQSGLVVGLGFQLLLGLQAHGYLTGALGQLMVGIGGGVLGVWLFDLITLVGSVALGQTAMGAGDAKLAAMMGAWLGWKFLLLASFLGCALGAFAGGVGDRPRLVRSSSTHAFWAVSGLGSRDLCPVGGGIASLVFPAIFPGHGVGSDAVQPPGDRNRRPSQVHNYKAVLTLSKILSN